MIRALRVLVTVLVALTSSALTLSFAVGITYEATPAGPITSVTRTPGTNPNRPALVTVQGSPVAVPFYPSIPPTARILPGAPLPEVAVRADAKAASGDAQVVVGAAATLSLSPAAGPGGPRHNPCGVKPGRGMSACVPPPPDGDHQEPQLEPKLDPSGAGARKGGGRGGPPTTRASGTDGNRAEAAGAFDDALTYATRAEKLDHIFVPRHNLDALVQQLGSREAVVEQMLRGVAGRTPESGAFELPTVISGQRVVVRGAVVDGVVKLGTAFTP